MFCWPNLDCRSENMRRISLQSGEAWSIIYSLSSLNTTPASCSSRYLDTYSARQAARQGAGFADRHPVPATFISRAATSISTRFANCGAHLQDSCLQGHMGPCVSDLYSVSFSLLNKTFKKRKCKKNAFHVNQCTIFSIEQNIFWLKNNAALYY